MTAMSLILQMTIGGKIAETLTALRSSNRQAGD